MALHTWAMRALEDPGYQTLLTFVHICQQLCTIRRGPACVAVTLTLVVAYLEGWPDVRDRYGTQGVVATLAAQGT